MPGYSTPIVWEKQLILHRYGEITAHDAVDGTRIWSVSATTSGASTPVIGKDVLFVCNRTNFGEPDLLAKLPDFETLVKQNDKDGDGLVSESEFPDNLAIARRPELEDNVEGAHFLIKRFFQGVDRNQDGSLDQTEWKGIVDSTSRFQEHKHGLVAIKHVGENDTATAQIVWQENKSVAEVPSPLYYDGRVYMIKNGGIVSCLDAESGKLLFRERLGAAGPYFSSPICADGKIYIASGKEVITVFAAGDTLQVLARNKLGEQVFATPAVVEHKLYVRTVKHMYAFGE